MARYGQMFLLSSCIFIAYFSLNKLNISKRTKLFCVCLISLWPAFYYFTPILYAEALSIFLFFCLLYFVIRLGNTKHWRYVFMVGSILACLVYTNPNHIFLFVPMLMYFLKAWGWNAHS